MDLVQPLLVVEDETLIRMNVLEVLVAGGFSVDEATDGSTALTDIGGRDVLHGLITDIQLGSGANGWQVARHAREKFPNIAVVYMSGDSAEAWSAEGVPNSIMLQKPFADAQLLSAVTTLLAAAGSHAAPADPPANNA